MKHYQGIEQARRILAYGCKVLKVQNGADAARLSILQGILFGSIRREHWDLKTWEQIDYIIEHSSRKFLRTLTGTQPLGVGLMFKRLDQALRDSKEILRGSGILPVEHEEAGPL